MNFFLEDTNNYNNNAIEVPSDGGIMESMLQANLAWSNIMMESIQNEYVSSLNEDANAVVDNIKNWFKKVIEWFKKIGQKIQYFVRNIILKISNKTGVLKKNAEKLYPRAKENIAVRKEKRTCKIYDSVSWSCFGASKDYTAWKMTIDGINRDMLADLKKAQNITSDEFDKFEETQKGNKNQSLQKKDHEITANDVENAYKTLVSNEMNKKVEDMKKAANEAFKNANEGIKSAQKGSNAEGEEAKKEKKNCKARRKAVSICMGGISRMTKVLNMATMDALTILKAGASINKDKDKDKNKESK